MKKILFVAALLIGSLTFKADAQLRINLNLNIGSQPDWGPVGYDNASYYYMPDIDTYYDVNNHVFVYLNGGTWARSAYLPSRYSNYDLYNGYKVVVNEANPWNHAAVYRTRYAGYRGRHGQSLIRDSHDQRYANHWRGNNGRGNGNGFGRDRGNGNPHGNGNWGNNGNRGDQGHGNNGNRGDQGRGNFGNRGDQGHGNDNGHDNGHHGRP